MDRAYRATRTPRGRKTVVAIAGPCLAMALLFASTFLAGAEKAVGGPLLADETATATATLPASPTATATATGIPTALATPTATPTAGATGTATGIPTASATPTSQTSPTPSNTPVAVATPTATSPAAPTGPATEVSTASATPAATSTASPTGTATETATPTGTSTATATPANPTPTATPAPGLPLPVVSAPATISVSTTWTAGSVYLVSSTTVDAGALLTIEPGAVVKFSGSGPPRLEVHGALSARGTAGQPVVFTSHRDDAYGGDSNGDGSSSAPAGGDWGAIYVRSGGSATLEYAVVRYGGSPLPSASDRVWYRYSGTIQAEAHATLAVRHSALGQSQNTGTYLGGGAFLSIRYGG